MTNEADKPSVELPDAIRIPLDSLEADAGYLMGRVAADGSCASAMAESVKTRTRAIRAALTSAAAPAEQPATPLREVLSDERIKALAELHGATYIREGGLRSGYGFSSDEVIAFARALLEASAKERQ